MLLKDSGSGDFEQPEAGTYPATCYKIIDIGTQTSVYEGKQNTRRQVIIGWELAVKMSDSRPFSVSQFYTASLNEKAKLRAHLEAWRGKAFTPEELGGFDPKNLLGKSCLLSLVENEKGRIKVGGVLKLPKGMEAPKQENQSLYFSLDHFDREVFDGLSKGIKAIIVQSPEYQALSNPIATTDGSDQTAEEIPF